MRRQCRGPSSPRAERSSIGGAIIETIVLAAFTAAAMASVAPFVLRGALRSPAVGFALLSGVLLASVVVDPPIVYLGGFRVDLARDTVALLIGAVGLFRLLRHRRRPARLIVAVFAAIFVVGLVRGVTNYGLSGNLEFSGTLWILSGLTYGASFELDGPRRRAIRRVLMWSAAGLFLLAGAVWSGLLGDTVIPSPPAFLLAQAGVVALVGLLESERPNATSIVAVGALLGVGILLQHRTVWAATGIALVYLVAFVGRRRSRVLTALGAVAALAIVAQSLGVVGSRAEFAGRNLVESMQIAASDDRTYEWRQDYWRYTIATHQERGTGPMVYGAGYGAPWMTFGPLVDRLEGPHNQYIEFLVRFGVLGLGLWLALLAWTARQLWVRRRIGMRTGLSNQALLVLVLMQITWSITYWMDSWQPVLLGFAVAAAAGSGAVDRTSTPSGVDLRPPLPVGEPATITDRHLKRS